MILYIKCCSKTVILIFVYIKIISPLIFFLCFDCKTFAFAGSLSDVVANSPVCFWLECFLRFFLYICFNFIHIFFCCILSSVFEYVGHQMCLVSASVVECLYQMAVWMPMHWLAVWLSWGCVGLTCPEYHWLASIHCVSGFCWRAIKRPSKCARFYSMFCSLLHGLTVF